MKTSTMVHYILLIIGIALTYLSYKQFINTQELLSTGTHTKAKVIDYREIKDTKDGSTMYSPIFEYLTKNGERITYESNVQSSWKEYKLGERIDIVYDQDGESSTSYWGLYWSTLIPACFAGPFLIIGIGYLLFKFT